MASVQELKHHTARTAALSGDESEHAIETLRNDPGALAVLVDEHRIFREAIEKSPAAYCVYDAHDKLIAFNGAYETLHGAPGEMRSAQKRGEAIRFADLMRRQLRGQVPDDQLEESVAARVAAQRQADGSSIERNNNDRGYYRMIKYKLSCGAVAGLAFDITELKQREAELTDAKGVAEEAGRLAEEALQHEQTREREARLLAELGEWLQSCKSLDELFQIISRFMAKLFPGSSGELYIYSNSRDVLDGACEWNRDYAANAHIQADDCWALRRGRIYKYGAGLVDFVCNHASDIDETATDIDYLCVPIIAHGDTVGMLHIRFNTSGDEGQNADSPFGKGAHLFAVQCAEQISLAIANVKLRDELRDQSTKDPLTGLFNRRHFLDRCRKEISHADRYDQKIGLISIDVDHFKMFNDTHGHDAGDTVLRALGEIMSEMFDGEDVVSRFGGEEFSILLPNRTTEATIARAEELRQKVETLKIRYADKALPKITISLGVSEFPTCGRTPQEVLKSADKALYAAKDAGRNTVSLAGSLSGD